MLLLSTHLAGPRRRAATRSGASTCGRNATPPTGAAKEYVTDGKGRRIGKMVNGILVKQWLYRDQLKPVAELDGSGNIVAEFIYGTKSNVPDVVIRGGSTYRILSDQLGSPVMAVNMENSSDVALAASYSAWGERTLVAGSDEWMPLGFAGGAYDPDTKLTRFGARDYDSAIGRWTAKDTLRFRSSQTNFYVYVSDDPVNRSDPTGLDYAGLLLAQHCQAVVARDQAACAQSCTPPPPKNLCEQIWNWLNQGVQAEATQACLNGCAAAKGSEYQECMSGPAPGRMVCDDPECFA